MLSYFKPARASFKKGPKEISGKNVTIVEVNRLFTSALIFDNTCLNQNLLFHLSFKFYKSRREDFRVVMETF